MEPPFIITKKILALVSEIERNLGKVDGFAQSKPQPKLRKSNRIRTLHGSLAIEGNTLATEQITALLDGKKVLAPKNDIIEVLNANEAYELLTELNPKKSSDLLMAHRIMMKELIGDAGKWRTKNVGIMKLDEVSHLAPPPERVPFLMDDLFSFLDGDDHPIIQSCVFHYEFEFIHPFPDGNGRMGRFWHSLLLYHVHPVFEFIPVESIIKTHQQEYYEVLEKCDQQASSTLFVEFSLSTIKQALVEYLEVVRPGPVAPIDRLNKANLQFGDQWFSRKHYLAIHKDISTATASRDLKAGIEQAILERKGQLATSLYRFEYVVEA